MPLRKSVSTTSALKMLTTDKILVRFKMNLNFSCNSDQNNEKKVKQHCDDIEYMVNNFVCV